MVVLMRVLNKESILWILVKFKVRYGRGQSWLSYFNQIAVMIVAGYALLDLFHIENPASLTLMIIGFLSICTYVSFGYVLGWLDENWTWKKELEYGTKDLNPFMQGMAKDLSTCNEKLDKLLERKT